MIIWLSSVSILKSNANLDYEADSDYIYESLQDKNQKFSSRMPAWCICTYPDDIYSSYILSCSHDDPEDDVEIEVSNVEYVETTSINCKNGSSFKLFPDLTDHFGKSNIMLTNCMVPKNESINQLTNKISMNMKHLRIKFDKTKSKLKLDKNYFEGLLSLETLVIDMYKTNTTSLNANVFEHLDNLKYMMLLFVPLPDGIFDTLTKLQNLTIQSNIYKEFKGSDFNNHKMLVQFVLHCWFKYCSFDPLVFENLRNLEKLEIGRVEISHIKMSNMMNLKIVVILRGNCEVFDENMFFNSTNIEEIKLDQINLKSLPKNIFQHQKKLNILSLSSTQLTELFDGTFDNTQNITILNLSHNKLTSISRYVYL